MVRHRPELSVHQGQDRRGALRVRGIRARGQVERPAKRKAHLDELEKQFEDYRLQLEAVLAERQAARDKVAALEKTKVDAEKAQAELFAAKTRLNDKLRKIDDTWVTKVRNLPILDLANPSLKVAQVLPAYLRDDVIFTTTEKVDRCTTCHQGIDKKGFEAAPQPFTTHPNLELYVARSPRPREGRLHVLPPGPRPGHGLPERRPHAVHAPSRRRTGAVTSAKSTTSSGTSGTSP